MKNTLKLALTASLLCIGLNSAQAGSEQDVGEAAKRLKDLGTVFAEKGEGAFAFLNGTGTMGSMSGKGRVAEEMATEGATGYSNDPNAELVCVDANGNYAVHTSQQTLVGTSAVEGANAWRDADGITIVERARAALSRGDNSGITAIDYTQFSDAEGNLRNPREGKRPTENTHLVVADGRYVKGLPAGSFCATEGQLIGKDLDDSDKDRLGGKDAGEGKKGKDGDPTAPGRPGEPVHKKHHVKKHDAKKSAAYADEKATGETTTVETK